MVLIVKFNSWVTYCMRFLGNLKVKLINKSKTLMLLWFHISEAFSPNFILKFVFEQKLYATPSTSASEIARADYLVFTFVLDIDFCQTVREGHSKGARTTFCLFLLVLCFNQCWLSSFNLHFSNSSRNILFQPVRLLLYRIYCACRIDACRNCRIFLWQKLLRHQKAKWKYLCTVPQSYLERTEE